MRITDLLDKRSIAFDKNPANKQENFGYGRGFDVCKW